MLKVTVGHSNDPDSESAISEVIEQCLAQQDSDTPAPIAALLLAAIDFDHQLILDYIHDKFPDIALIGGTTDGEMSSKLQFSQDSLVLTLFYSDNIQIQAGLGLNLSHDPVAGAAEAVAYGKGQNTEIPKLCLTIVEGIGCDSNAAVEGLKAVLGDRFPIFGGATADQQQFKMSYQFFGREVLTDAITLLFLYGDLQFSCGIVHGWKLIGKVATLTEVSSNSVVKIDGKSATDLYESYLHGLEPSPEYPLAIFEESGEFYLRLPVGSNRETGKINFLTNLPTNTQVQVAHATREDILAATQDSFKIAFDRYPGVEPDVALLFSCFARRLILGTRTQEECQWVSKLSQQELPFVGFYTYGEIGPMEIGGEVRLHRETFITLLLGTR